MTQINREESCTPVSSDTPTQLVTQGGEKVERRTNANKIKAKEPLIITQIQRGLTTLNEKYIHKQTTLFYAVVINRPTKHLKNAPWPAQ